MGGYVGAGKMDGGSEPFKNQRGSDWRRGGWIPGELAGDGHHNCPGVYIDRLTGAHQLQGRKAASRERPLERSADHAGSAGEEDSGKRRPDLVGTNSLAPDEYDSRPENGTI